MDFITLTVQIQKQPTHYQSEFETILLQYIHLTTLPAISTKQALSYINFLTTTTGFYKSTYPETLLLHYTTTEDRRLKDEILNNLFILKHKHLIDDVSFFKAILHHADLTKILSRVIIEVKDYTGLIALFASYLKDGDDKQIRFSIFMLCYIYECGGKCEDIIVQGLIGEKKIQTICMVYLCNEIEFSKKEKSRILMEMGDYNASRIIEKLCKEIKRKELREVKIRKLRCIDILKKEYELTYDISTSIFQLIDPSKDDLKTLMELLVDNLDMNFDVIDKLIKTFCAEYRDDDFIVYGLNFLKEACLKYDIEDFVMERIDIFNKHKNSGVNLAYRGVIKALKEKESDGREITHIRRKSSREEKIEAKKAGQVLNKFRAKNRKKKKSKKVPKKILKPKRGVKRKGIQ